MDEIWIWIICLVLLVSCIGGGGIMYDREVCFQKAQGMGFEIQWTFWGGCKIEVGSGKWIPLESYYFKQE